MPYAAGTGPSGAGLVAMAVILTIFVCLSVAAGVTLLFRRPSRSGARRATAQRHLDEQFARGQLDEHEYLRLCAELTEKRPSKR